VLASLQHFRNQLWAALRRVSAAEVAPVMASPPAAFKAPAATITAPVTAVMTAATAPVASTSLRPLETRARVALDARGVAAFKLRPRRTGVARSACFAGQQDHVFFHGGFGNSTRGGNCGRFERNVLDRFVMRHVRAFGLGQFCLFFLALFFRLDFFLIAFVLLHFGGEAFFGFVDFLVTLLGKFFAFLFLLKVVTAHERVRFGARLGFLMFRFHETGGQRRQLFFAQTGGAVALHVALYSFFRNFLGMSRGCLGRFR